MLNLKRKAEGDSCKIYEFAICFPVQGVTRQFEGNKIFTLNGLTAMVSFNANQEIAMVMVAVARVNIVQNRQAYIRKRIRYITRSIIVIKGR